MKDLINDLVRRAKGRDGIAFWEHITYANTWCGAIRWDGSRLEYEDEERLYSSVIPVKTVDAEDSDPVYLIRPELMPYRLFKRKKGLPATPFEFGVAQHVVRQLEPLWKKTKGREWPFASFREQAFDMYYDADMWYFLEEHLLDEHMRRSACLLTDEVIVKDAEVYVFQPPKGDILLVDDPHGVYGEEDLTPICDEQALIAMLALNVPDCELITQKKSYYEVQIPV